MRVAQGTGSWLLTGVICSMVFFIIFVYVGGFISILAFLFFVISVSIEVFLLVFFRDPERDIGDGVVAVADGVIREVSEIVDKDTGKSICVSTFMNIYHVHVNRMPIDGRIQKMNHIPGAHIPAFQKDSLRNERMISLIKTDYGPVKIIQIAGTLARRIVNYYQPGKQLKKGQRYGIIRLGSRVDLLIPKKHLKKILVKKGDHVRAGEHQILSMQ